MLIIKTLVEEDGERRYERIGEYSNGEFSGQERVTQGLTPLEGQPEAEIQRSLDGPHTVAVAPDGDGEGAS